MKLALINGSPKPHTSASKLILDSLKKLLVKENQIEEYHFRTPALERQFLNRITHCHALVFSFPLYVDGIPSHLVHSLCQMDAFLQTNPAQMLVYCTVNCGFYEGRQAAVALELMRNWCARTGLTWGQGIGIGGGPMLLSLTHIPDGHGPKKSLGRALHILANNISAGTSGEDLLISPNFPRLAYKLAAEMGWRQQAKANGLKAKDLSRRR